MQWKENSRLTSAGNSEEIDSLKEQLLNKDKWCKARVEQVCAWVQTAGSFSFPVYLFGALSLPINVFEFYQSQAEYLDAMSTVEQLREDKHELEKEIMELKMGRSSENLIRKKLFASEVCRF